MIFIHKIVEYLGYINKSFIDSVRNSINLKFYQYLQVGCITKRKRVLKYKRNNTFKKHRRIQTTT